MKNCCLIVLYLIFSGCGLWVTPWASAQDATPKPAPGNAEAKKIESGSLQGAEDEVPDLLGGALSAEGQIVEDNKSKRGFFRFPTTLKPLVDLKAHIRKEYGLNFSFSYGLLYQGYSDSLVNETNAFSHKFAFNLSWKLINPGERDAGSINLAVEDRRALGTRLPPLFAGVLAGSMVPTAATWSDFGSGGITQFYWRQNFFKDRLQFNIGKIFAPNYVDTYPFFDDNGFFLNQSFSTNPTIASALRGFGAVVAGYPTKTNFYLLGGIYNANSDDTGVTIDNFFTENEYFYQFEAGWSGLAKKPMSLAVRGALDPENIHMTVWFKDRQSARDIDPSWGIAFNANGVIRERFKPFLRIGWSDGRATLVDTNVSVGLGWQPRGENADFLGIGFSWASPSDDNRISQYTTELFYRFQVTENLAITPDIQMIVNPSLNRDTDILWVGGIRTRVSF